MSGGGGNPTAAAQQQQAQQQAEIAAGTNQVQQTFASPALQQQYQQLGQATTNYYTNELNQQQTQAQNQLQFALAGEGQIGGSVQADQNATLDKEYDQGLLQAGQLGEQASASLQSQDTQTEAQLIAAVQGGESGTQAATQAAEAEQSNLASATANSQVSQLGNLFGNVSTIYNNEQTAQANQLGQLYGYTSVFSPGFGAAPSYSIPGGSL
jgi:hypothetical protein